jgi:hypothetical protein
LEALWSRRRELLHPSRFLADDSQALILAHERSNLYGDLLNRVRGVAFMGTPHRGSDSAFWASFLANVLYVANVGLNTNRELVAALKKESTTLSKLSEQFIERGARLQITTFYETEKFDYLNCVVSSSTALPCIRMR